MGLLISCVAEEGEGGGGGARKSAECRTRGEKREWTIPTSWPSSISAQKISES